MQPHREVRDGSVAPQPSQGVIDVDAPASGVVKREVGQPVRALAFSRLSEPFHRLRVVHLDAVALREAKPDVLLRLGVPLLQRYKSNVKANLDETRRSTLL